MPADPPANGPRFPMGFVVIGSEMASFTLLGLLIDYLLSTIPWFTVGMTLLGFAHAFSQLMKVAKKLAGKKKEQSGDQPQE